VRIKVDEDLPRAVADVFSGAGYHVVTVPEQGWSGWADARIWAAVRTEGWTEGRILVTANKGFADLRRLRTAGAEWASCSSEFNVKAGRAIGARPR
jgi:predicted nuclease of predicted toxin-antitoxin system